MHMKNFYMTCLAYIYLRVQSYSLARDSVSKHKLSIKKKHSKALRKEIKKSTEKHQINQWKEYYHIYKTKITILFQEWILCMYLTRKFIRVWRSATLQKFLFNPTFLWFFYFPTFTWTLKLLSNYSQY